MNIKFYWTPVGHAIKCHMYMGVYPTGFSQSHRMGNQTGFRVDDAKKAKHITIWVGRVWAVDAGFRLHSRYHILFRVVVASMR